MVLAYATVTDHILKTQRYVVKYVLVLTQFFFFKYIKAAGLLATMECLSYHIICAYCCVHTDWVRLFTGINQLYLVLIRLWN